MVRREGVTARVEARKPWEVRRGMARLVAATLLVSMLLVGCGGSGNGGGGQKAGAPATVRVGVIPIVDVAPLYLGERKGFFQKRNLTLKLTAGSGGATIVPSVVSGDLDIGFGNNVSNLQAASKGIPLRIVASGAYSTGKRGKDYVGVVAPKGSPIKTAKDLEGHTVAVNTLQNLGDVTVRASVDAAGGDSSKVKFVEVEFPDMSAALGRGSVDAIWTVEPFLSIATKQQGGRVVAWSLVDAAKDMMVATYFTTERYAQSHRDVVRRFKAAMDQSLQYAQQHPDEVRRVLLTYTKIPAKAASTITLPRWDPAISQETLRRLESLATRYKLIKKHVSPDELLLK
jgi:NitT/TauT family transport system substrate-binding protein